MLFRSRFRLRTSNYAREQILTVDDIGTWDDSGTSITINTTKVITTSYITAIYSTKRTSLEKYPLENLDVIRDNILMTPGDTVFDLSNPKMSTTPFINFTKRTKEQNLVTTNPQFGLCLKTYNSDVYQKTITKDEIRFRLRTSNYAREQTLTVDSYRDWETDRKSTRLNSSHSAKSRMPSSA